LTILEKKNKEFILNAAGRMVPEIVNGHSQTPFQGIGKFQPGKQGCVTHPECSQLSREW
jgi:hypothetical protein